MVVMRDVAEDFVPTHDNGSAICARAHTRAAPSHIVANLVVGKFEMRILSVNAASSMCPKRFAIGRDDVVGNFQRTLLKRVGKNKNSASRIGNREAINMRR